MLGFLVGDRYGRTTQINLGIRTPICQSQHFAAQAFPRQAGGISRHKRLARGRCLARIRCYICVGTQQCDISHWHTQCLSKNLRNNGVRSLPDIRRPLVQKKSPLRRDTRFDRRRVWQRCIATAIPTSRNTNASFEISIFSVVGRTELSFTVPCRRQRLQTGFHPDPLFKHLTTDCRCTVFKRIHHPKLQGVYAQKFSQLVKQAFLRNRRLRHTKPTKCTGGRTMGINSSRFGAVIGNLIRARRMHRHPIGHRRAP